ncbi:acylase [Adhaeribacter aquaticus]|uniref:acylase n=1 Tax=Adhaeribacter aquaticus TaxID=299567 RepID=UPI0006873356|nr:acylase [Adhaeribacter aquaticus]
MKAKLFRQPWGLLLIIIMGQFPVKQIHAQNKSSEILWDNYGVPHIYGTSIEEMYYGFGWSQMHNHGNLILRLYGEARGKGSEYWGERANFFDRAVHLFNLPERAIASYNKQNNTYKKYLDAFTNGVNAYAKAHPEAIAEEIKQVLPIKPTDVLSHTMRVINIEFMVGAEAGKERASPPGSNAMAISPSKSASKNAMLVANPHLAWEYLFTFFEAHLNGPDFNAYGAALVGMPFLAIAFNDNLGWTHTVNTIDAVDRYELTLQNDGYLLDGVQQPFEVKKVTFKVRQPDGSFQEKKVELKSTKHGPVLIGQNGKSYAIRAAGWDNYDLMWQYHKMGQSKNWQEFEANVKMMQMPMFNLLYADKAGNIFYLFGGNVPKRSEGNGAFWEGAVPGTESKYIWTQTHPYQDLPKLFNPKSGFVHNANDAPWTSTYPVALNPKNYPAYMAPLKMDLRAQRGVNLIKDDSSITFEELVNYKMNTGLEAADRFLNDLLQAVEKYPDSAASRAAQVLKAWDKQTNANSKGAVLFATWFDKVNPGMFGNSMNFNPDMITNLWRLEQPVTTPNGLKDPQKAVALLVQAANEVKQKYGAMDVAWGDVNRFKRGSLDIPGNGGNGLLGIYRTMQFREAPDKKAYAIAGEGYIAVTEFGPKVKAQVLLAYGNASQPGSKHISDQLQLLADKKLRPALLEKAAVLQNLEKRERIIYSPEKNHKK